MKHILSILLLFIVLQIFSQKKVYVSENLTYIDADLFKKKCARMVVECIKFKLSKDTIISAIWKKYEFGKFTNPKMNLIEKELNNGNKLEKTRTLNKRIGFFYMSHEHNCL